LKIVNYSVSKLVQNYFDGIQYLIIGTLGGLDSRLKKIKCVEELEALINS
jgi:hypothetical protein